MSHFFNSNQHSIHYFMLQNDGNSPWLKFARGVVDGVYAKQDVLLGMVEALVIKTERLAKGKSLKNMSYPSAFSDFCNVLASTSTRAYKTFKRQFGGRGIRSMQYVVSYQYSHEV